MILGYNMFCVKISVGNVSFESVPLAVFIYLLFTDGNFYVLADFKKLVVATLVYLILGNSSTLVCFSQSGNATVTVVGILLRTFVRIADDKSFSILTFVVVASLVCLLQ